MLKRLPTLVLFLLLAAGFAVGLVQLFRWRFESGDVYPAYSSLRADPLGAKALFESLGSLPSLTVERNFRPLERLPEVKDAAVLCLGLDAPELERASLAEVRRLERVALDGGRVVIAFFPEGRRPARRLFDRGEPGAAPKQKKPAGGESRQAGEDQKTADKAGTKEPPKAMPRAKGKGELARLRETRVSLDSLWGVSFDYRDLERNKEGAYEPVTVESKGDTHLPSSLAWHSAMVFSRLDRNWRALYERDGHAVVAERRFGRGSLVLLSDSYFASNEALVADRQPALLAWMLGPARRVVFDESHLGVEEAPGLMALARKYRLHGFLAGLAVLAALFVWKNTATFMPPRILEVPEIGQAGDVVLGRESSAGFVNLLRRNVAESTLLQTCFRQWHESGGPARRDWARKQARVEQILQDEEQRPARERNPVIAYRAICAVLAERQ